MIEKHIKDCQACKMKLNLEEFNKMRDGLLIEFKGVDTDELEYPFFFHIDEAHYIYNLIQRDIAKDEK